MTSGQNLLYYVRQKKMIDYLTERKLKINLAKHKEIRYNISRYKKLGLTASRSATKVNVPPGTLKCASRDIWNNRNICNPI